jgi:hypothetical protein
MAPKKKTQQDLMNLMGLGFRVYGPDFNFLSFNFSLIFF